MCCPGNKKLQQCNSFTPYEDTRDEYKTVFVALELTELWIISIYLSRSTLNKEKRGLEPVHFLSI